MKTGRKEGDYRKWKVHSIVKSSKIPSIVPRVFEKATAHYCARPTMHCDEPVLSNLSNSAAIPGGRDGKSCVRVCPCVWKYVGVVGSESPGVFDEIAFVREALPSKYLSYSWDLVLFSIKRIVNCHGSLIPKSIPGRFWTQLSNLQNRKSSLRIKTRTKE